MAYRIVSPILKKYSDVVVYMLNKSYELTKLNRTFTFYISDGENKLYDILTVRTDNRSLANEIALLVNATINVLEYTQYDS